MRGDPPPPALRLIRADPSWRGADVRTHPPRPERVAARVRTARRDVATENHLAAGLSPHDARLIFARRVVEQLEGGRAAILRPEQRRRLVTIAQSIGLRAFDANLVIAVAQDAARRGERVEAATTTATLACVGSARHEDRPLLLLFLAAAAALVLLGFAVLWIGA